MLGLLFAEAAILLQRHTIRIVLLVLHRVVIALLTLGASQRDLCAHIIHLPKW